MKQVTLKSPKPLGENDPKYGQTWWGYTYDSETPVMFNLMEGSVGDGSVITAETVELKTSNKGTEYHRLKKVRISGEAAKFSAPTSVAVPADNGKMLQLIFDNTDQTLRLVKQLTGEEEAPSLGQAWKQATGGEADTVVEDIGDEPMDISDIPF